MKNAEHARAMKELERVLIENADWVTEKEVRELLALVGIDYDQAKAKYESEK